MRSPILLLWTAVLAPAALAQAPQEDTRADAVAGIRAAPLQGEVRIDGRLDEPVWGAAEAAGGFTQSWPNSGAPASQRTEARVLAGPDALYVAMRMHDTAPDSIVGQLARRDAAGGYSDRALVFIDSRGDRRSAFAFSVNPRGVKQDDYIFDDTQEDASWDAVWEVATQVDSLGWTAEFRIPYSQLRFAGGGGRAWGLGLMREIARYEERSSWAPWSNTDPGFVSRFGRLTGVEGIRPPRRLEVLPYTSARLARAPREAGNPFLRANDPGVGAGVDLTAGLPFGLTLSATVNPDFGQVEVDPARINLSAFETFYPERRPFFTEGADVFRFGDVRSFNNYGFQRFFYSRRVGRAPQRRIRGDEVAFVDAPDQTTILGAAKVSGKTAGGWSVGLMNAVTAEETGSWADLAGAQHRTPVEPVTSYTVGRVRRDLRGGGTVVGAIGTATHRDMGGGVFDGSLHSAAYLSGLDFEHRWGKGEWALSGFMAASRVEGTREALRGTQRTSARYLHRPDADYLEYDPERTSLQGSIAQVALQRSGSWDGSLSYKEASPGLELGDLGFQGRTDYRAVTTFLGRRINRPTGPFRGFAAYGYSYHAWNFGGDLLENGFALAGQGTFRNLWWGNVGLTRNTARYDDRLTWGGPLARVPGSWRGELGLGSDGRKPVSGSVRFSSSLGDDRGSAHDVGFSLEVRPSSSVRLSVGPELSRVRDPRQFVTSFDDPAAERTFGRRYVFAELEQVTAAMSARLDWTFTPTLSLQLFAQPYVSAGEYRGYKEFTTPGAEEYAAYGTDRGTLCAYEGEYALHPTRAAGSCPSGVAEAEAEGFTTLDDPDFTFRSLRGNAVLRWEYRPGSALFVVWQQDRSGREGHGDFRLGRDGRALFGEPARNVLLLKATYWIGR